MTAQEKKCEGCCYARGTQAGGIVGTNSGTIRNCSSYVTVEAINHAGGIARLADSSSSITGCQVKGAMQNQNALLCLRQCGESLGHKLVVDM